MPFDITVNTTTTPATGGTVSIVSDRTVLQCAPDSVRLGVDLSAATFGIDGPGEGEYYDARLHLLFFEWDFGDASASWSAPVNVLANWVDPDKATGPFVAHMYRDAGTYTITLTVTNPANGLTAEDTLEVTVATQDSAYPGGRTICVSPTGSTTGAPAGATVLTSSEFLQAEMDANDDASNPTRILFEKGQTFDLAVDLTSAQAPGVLFGAYGSGARPILNPLYDGTLNNGCITIGASYGGQGSATHSQLTLSGLDFRGNFDPVTELVTDSATSKARECILGNHPIDLIVDDCRFDGWQYSTFRFQDPTGDDTGRFNFHFNDTLVTNFGGAYSFISEAVNNEDSTAAFTGCGWVQTSGAHADSEQRGAIRINCVARTYIACVDIFGTNTDNIALKLGEIPQHDGLLINCHDVSIEGYQWGVSLNRNSVNGVGNRSTAMNAVLERMIIAGNYDTTGGMYVKAGGVTLRNILFVMPDVPHTSLGPAYLGAIHVEELGGTADADVVLDAPIRAYNCTMLVERQQSENNNRVPDFLYLDNNGNFSDPFTNILGDHNLIHQPNLTSPETTFAPVTTASLFTARTTGHRPTSTGTLDTAYATPAGSIKDTKPDTGSAALGGATSGLVAYDDISEGGAVVRGDAASVDDGAWQVTA